MLYRGNLVWKGHRAYGSMFFHVLLSAAAIGSTGYLKVTHTLIANLSNYNLPYHLSLIGHSDVWTGLLSSITVLWLLYKRYQWTFIVTDKEMIVREGLLARNVREYLYNEVQDAHQEQTLIQRALLWGGLRFSLLQSGTGIAQPADVYMPYVSRPYHVAQFVIQNVKVIGIGAGTA